MALTVTWNTAYEAIPADIDQANTLGDVIRDLKRDIRERGEIDHDWDDTTNSGKHNKVTLQQLGAAPTNISNEGYVYQKNVGSNGELFYEDEAGNEVQITAVGEINAAVIAEYAKDLVVTGSDIIIDNTQGFQAKDVGGTPRDLALITGLDVVNLGNIAYPASVKVPTLDDLTIEYGSGEKKVWHEGNDGLASTLDADLVQGFDFTGAASDHNLIRIKGHYLLPGDFLINWAFVSSVTASGTSDTFDKAFSIYFGATASDAENVAGVTFVSYSVMTNTTITLVTGSGSRTAFYIAIGKA